MQKIIRTTTWGVECIKLLTWGFECFLTITIYAKSEANLRYVVLFIIEHPFNIFRTMVTQKVTSNSIRNFTDIKIEYGAQGTVIQ